jgi:hypothetical protein
MRRNEPLDSLRSHRFQTPWSRRLKAIHWPSGESDG